MGTKLLSVKQIQDILCLAIKNKLLIITLGNKYAADIKEDIINYIRSNGLGTTLSSQDCYGYIHFSGGFQNIAIMSAAWWNSHSSSVLEFDGLVFTTNSTITDICNIKNTPLPITTIWNKKEGVENDRCELAKS